MYFVYCFYFTLVQAAGIIVGCIFKRDQIIGTGRTVLY